MIVLYWLSDCIISVEKMFAIFIETVDCYDSYDINLDHKWTNRKKEKKRKRVDWLKNYKMIEI
jgi:hypothetical protein